MYFLQLSFSNARHAGSGELRIRRTRGNIAKWTVNNEGPEGLELLQLIAAACGGTRIVPRLHFDLGRLGRAAADYLQIELVLAQEFGRPHLPLVDTIFRYNQRERRGHYLANLLNAIAERVPVHPD